jgi:hypothetical protein
MAKKGNKVRKSWQKRGSLPTWQKVLIVAVLSFIPFLFFVILTFKP